MVISKYTQNLYASEVYRELERQAVKKGFFNPSEEYIVKNAADMAIVQAKVNAKVSAEPTEDLIQDVASLAYALRRKGFVSYAEDIENKLVMYKRAEKEWYDVTTEKNQDFIDLAHKDGDVQIIEGAGELGQIETQKSLAEKILGVVNKEPTGKLGMLASLILKNAQEGNSETGTNNEDTKRVARVYEDLSNKLKSFPDMQGIKFEGFDFTNIQIANIYVTMAAAAGSKKLNPSSVVEAKKTFNATKTMLGGSDPFEPASWIKWLNDNNPQTIIQKANEFGVDRSVLYGFSYVKWGTQKANTLDEIINGKNGQMADFNQIKGTIQPNPNSLFAAELPLNIVITSFTPIVNKTKISTVGPLFCTAFVKKYYDPIFGTNGSIIELASNYMFALPGKISESVTSLEGHLKVPNEVADELGNIKPEVFSIINTIESELNKIFSSEDMKNLKFAYSGLRSTIPDQFKNWKEKFDSEISKAEIDISGPGGQTIDVNGIIASMKKITDTFTAAAKNFGSGTKQYESILNYMKKINEVKYLLNRIGRKPTAVILNELRKIDYTSIDDLNNNLEQVKTIADKALAVSTRNKAKR